MSGQLKEVRERISSVKSTQQITKAMKMVSAAKLRKAQMAIVQMRPYADRLNKMLINILSNLEGGGSTVFNVEREVNRALVVPVTSNRGLAGAFNSNVIKAAVSVIETDYAHLKDGDQLSILCVGKKGYDFFKRNYPQCNIITDYVNLFSDLSFDAVAEVPKHLMEEFANGNYDSIQVAYGKFKNAALQFPTIEKFLPVPKLEVSNKEASKRRADYIFEPDKESLLEHLIPSILQTQFYKYVLDTHASEHGARMTAMDNATENAEELVKDLKISYNKARQEAITKELSEIVGGAAALGG